MEQKYLKKKWFEDKALLVILFFILPPLGIYGMLKRNTVTWKKAIYILPASFSIFLFIILIIGGFYNYDNSNNKLENLRDSTNIAVDEVKNEISPVDINKLTEFQKTWTDSIVKVENTPSNGYHLVGSKLVLPDTIYLEYSAGITKLGFDVNMQNDTTLYRKWYKDAVLKKLGTNYSNYPVYIIPIANRNVVSKIDKNINYVHPALAFKGIKIYKGNDYYKEFVGNIVCVYNDPDKGSTDMYNEIVMIKTKKGITEIPHYNLRKYYWTTDKENDMSQNVFKCN